MSNTDPGIRDIVVDDVICFPVAGEYIFKCDKRTGYIFETGRHATVKVTSDQDDIGFIEGYPVSDIF
jgi:hypothetical protein